MDHPVERAKEIEGWMYPEELEWLWEVSKRMNDIVELGCYKGRSTYVLCSGCQGKVYAVDCHWCEALRPFVGNVQHTFHEFMENVGHFPNMVPLEMNFVDAAVSDLILPMVDMVFDDGGHTYESVLLNLEAWEHRAKKLVCGHDLKDEYPGVEKALNKYFGKGKWARGPGSIWYVDK